MAVKHEYILFAAVIVVALGGLLYNFSNSSNTTGQLVRDNKVYCEVNSIRGDADGDGKVTNKDVQIAQSVIKKSMSAPFNRCCLDLIKDGVVDDADLQLIKDAAAGKDFGRCQQPKCPDNRKEACPSGTVCDNGVCIRGKPEPVPLPDPCKAKWYKYPSNSTYSLQTDTCRNFRCGWAEGGSIFVSQKCYTTKDACDKDCKQYSQKMANCGRIPDAQKAWKENCEKQPQPKCTDSIKNGNEADIDCGGGTCTTKCANGKTCTANTDCTSSFCNPSTKMCEQQSSKLTCTDTDACILGGSPPPPCQNPFYIKGTITIKDPTGRQKSYTDYCQDANALQEYHCLFDPEHQTVDNAYNLEYTRCPNGCSNGACKTAPQETTCTDSDGGKKYTVQGTAYDNRYYKDGLIDNCGRHYQYDHLILYEGYCEGGFVQTEVYDCPNGCSNGACK